MNGYVDRSKPKGSKKIKKSYSTAEHDNNYVIVGDSTINNLLFYDANFIVTLGR